jgi:hypothetical protein
MYTLPLLGLLIATIAKGQQITLQQKHAAAVLGTLGRAKSATCSDPVDCLHGRHYAFTYSYLAFWVQTCVGKKFSDVRKVQDDPSCTPGHLIRQWG